MFRFLVSLLVPFYLLCLSVHTILVHDIVMMSCGQLSGAGGGRSFTSSIQYLHSLLCALCSVWFPCNGVEFNFFEWFC